MTTLDEVAAIRAGRSTEPIRFMNIFDATLGEIQRGGDVMDRPLDYTDPLSVAAEIEALAAATRQASCAHKRACSCVPCHLRRHGRTGR